MEFLFGYGKRTTKRFSGNQSFARLRTFAYLNKDSDWPRPFNAQEIDRTTQSPHRQKKEKNYSTQLESLSPYGEQTLSRRLHECLVDNRRQIFRPRDTGTSVITNKLIPPQTRIYFNRPFLFPLADTRRQAPSHRISG